MFRPKSRAKWNKKPVGIRAAYIGGAFAILGVILSGVFILAVTLLSNSTEPPVSKGEPTRHHSKFVHFSKSYFPSKIQVPCPGNGQPTAGFVKYNRTNAPFKANVYRLYEYLDGIAFPGVLTKADQESVVRSGSESPVIKNQGYEIGSSVLDLTITARRRTIQILQMRALVMRCQSVAEGSLLLPGYATSPIITVTGIYFMLGARDPVALRARAPYGNYFNGHVFEITPSHHVTFQITAWANYGAFEWEIDVAVLEGNVVHTYLIGDSGHPFLTTDSPPKGHQYRVVFQPCTGKLCAGMPVGTLVRVKD